MRDTSSAPGVPAAPGASGAGRARTPGLALALLSAFAFGGSGVAAKPLIEAGLEPLHVTWLRVAGAALVLLPLAWRHRSLVRERPALLLGFGLLAVAGVQAFYFAALSRIPVGVALLIEYLAPAMVLGWVRFVQRRPVTRAAAVGVVLAVGGLCCVVEIWAGLRLDGIGLLLALGAACCQVGYFVLSDHGSSAADGRRPADPLGVIAYGLLVGALVLTLVARPWRMDWPVLAGQAGMNGTQVPGLLLLAWVVLVATVTAYLTGVISIRRLSPQVAGVVACLEAVIATVLAWVLLGERLAAVQLVGGAVVLLGAFIAQRATPAGPAGPAGAEGAELAGEAVASEGVASERAASEGVASEGVASEGVALEGAKVPGESAPLEGAVPLGGAAASDGAAASVGLGESVGPVVSEGAVAAESPGEVAASGRSEGGPHEDGGVRDFSAR